MSQKKSSEKQEIETIIDALSGFSKGASLQEIRTSAKLLLSDRTLQRRLKLLIEQNKITAAGAQKNRIYKMAPPSISVPGIHRKVALDSAPFSLTEHSQNLLTTVSMPIEKRIPVGYNRQFLEQYQPNETSYLHPIELNRLNILGQTANMDQPAGTYARQVLNRLLIDLSWNSSRLEGNSYSLLETHRLLDEGRAPANKKESDTQMILNHKDAIEFLVENTDNAVGFNRYSILSLHALLSNNLLPDSAASGRLRTHAVGIGRSVYHPPDTPQMIEEFFDMILQKADAIANPFEQAFFIMVHIPYLQPFDDVNKRVSRLAANIPLNRRNLAPLSFTDTPEELYISGLLAIYELNRFELLKEVFIYAYQRSAARYASVRQTLGEPDSFRLKYRTQIGDLIGAIIKGAKSKTAASVQIQTAALSLPLQDSNRFINSVESELLSLHEGNFARYKVTPSDFKKWKDGFV